VGKTAVTALLLLHLRKNKVNARAIKPFCSGTRDDVALLQSLQPGELSDAAVNPYYYNQPLAPMAARGKHVIPRVQDVLVNIKALQHGVGVLLIEGAGGVMVPISRNFCIVDLIGALRCEVLLIARNQLGTLNHTLLSVAALKKSGVDRIKIILIDPPRLDLSGGSNLSVLEKMLPGICILRLPFSPQNLNKTKGLGEYVKKINKTLARMLVHP
jgi:dethiobiotin synthetase